MALDREQEFLERSSQLIRTRPPGTSPAGASRDEALSLVDGIMAIPSNQTRGGLGCEAAISPAVRRRIRRPSARPAGQAARRRVGFVFQTTTDEVGRRGLAGQDFSHIVDELRPSVECLLDSLDRWFSLP